MKLVLTTKQSGSNITEIHIFSPFISILIAELVFKSSVGVKFEQLF